MRCRKLKRGGADKAFDFESDTLGLQSVVNQLYKSMWPALVSLKLFALRGSLPTALFCTQFSAHFILIHQYAISFHNPRNCIQNQIILIKIRHPTLSPSLLALCFQQRSITTGLPFKALNFFIPFGIHCGHGFHRWKRYHVKSIPFFLVSIFFACLLPEQYYCLLARSCIMQ